MTKLTSCFPSIGVENVNVTTFLPSFKFKDASCSDVGVIALSLFLLSLLLLTLSSSAKSMRLLPLRVGWPALVLLDLLKEKGHSLQLPPDATMASDWSDSSILSTPINSFGSNMLSPPIAATPKTIETDLKGNSIYLTSNKHRKPKIWIYPYIVFRIKCFSF